MNRIVKKPNRYIYLFLICSGLLFAKCEEPLNININGLKIETFIQTVSKLTNKNILLTDQIDGEVDFISNTPICKNELFNILTYVLDAKNYILIDNNKILRIVKRDTTNKAKDSKQDIELINLKNIEAKNILPIINSVINKKPAKSIKNSTFASIDEESNSIILIGAYEELKELKKLIFLLDVDKQQVYVQARIIEISETKINNLGVQWGLNAYNSSGSSLSTFSSQLNGGSNVSTVSLNSLSDYGYDISTLKNGLSLGATINLLKQNYALDVVSEPSILCINNKESSIYVGETKSIQTAATTSSSGSTTSTYSREDIGLTLKVKPRISNGNKVTLSITTTLEDASATSTNEQPDTTKKEVLTTAIVNNAESVIIGGLIKNKQESSEDKIPLLGDIPILGALFKNKYTVNDKINLVVIVTPYIIPKTKDLSFVRDKLAELKILEDKYTKNIQQRIEKKKLEVSKKNTNNNVINHKFDMNNKSYLQNKRVKETFGI